jgi:hypothetical protein
VSRLAAVVARCARRARRVLAHSAVSPSSFAPAGLRQQ